MYIALITLIILTVLVSCKGFKDTNFFRKYEFNINKIDAGEKYRMFTSGFLHSDIKHMLFNLITLVFFAPIVSKHFGELYFTGIYIGSLLIGSFFAYYVHQEEYFYRYVGSSGAVMGIIYGAILLEPFSDIGFTYLVSMKSYFFGLLYLIYTLYRIKLKDDKISHAAHFGGAIGGLVLTILVQPCLMHTRSYIVIGLLILIPLVFVMYLTKIKKL